MQEEELRGRQDPKYYHLQEDLHVEITAFAPPAEAHARVAFALTEVWCFAVDTVLYLEQVRKYLIPDSNDDIRQEQMREMELLTVTGGGAVGGAGEKSGQQPVSVWRTCLVAREWAELATRRKVRAGLQLVLVVLLLRVAGLEHLASAEPASRLTESQVP